MLQWRMDAEQNTVIRGVLYTYNQHAQFKVWLFWHVIKTIRSYLIVQSSVYLAQFLAHNEHWRNICCFLYYPERLTAFSSHVDLKKRRNQFFKAKQMLKYIDYSRSHGISWYWRCFLSCSLNADSSVMQVR